MKKQNGTAVAAVREIGEAKIGWEAVKRAGKNMNLKGIIHEVMVKDSYNFSPKRFIDGNKAVLSKATNAVRDDLLIKNGSKIVGRMQLKDTPASISKTVKQVKDGHYVGTKLFGTKETVSAYNNAVSKAVINGKNITQKMSSTKISSSDTLRIAKKTVGKTAGKLPIGAVGKVALSSGAAGAVFSGGIEAVSSGIKLAQGKISVKEFAGKVAKETAGGGLSAAGGSVAATYAAAGAATLLSATAAPVWVPAAIGVGAAVVAGGITKKVWDFCWAKK